MLALAVHPQVTPRYHCLVGMSVPRCLAGLQCCKPRDHYHLTVFYILIAIHI